MIGPLPGEGGCPLLMWPYICAVTTSGYSPGSQMSPACFFALHLSLDQGPQPVPVPSQVSWSHPTLVLPLLWGKHYSPLIGSSGGAQNYHPPFLFHCQAPPRPPRLCAYSEAGQQRLEPWLLTPASLPTPHLIWPSRLSLWASVSHLQNEEDAIK